MSIAIHVTGLDKAVKAMRKQAADADKNVQKALIVTGLSILREAVKNAPVDTGNLRGSAYAVWPKSTGKLGKKVNPAIVDVARAALGQRPGIVVGFSAAYAWFVHEVKARHRVGDWKFLERAYRLYVPRIQKYMREAYFKSIQNPGADDAGERL